MLLQHIENPGWYELSVSPNLSLFVLLPPAHSLPRNQQTPSAGHTSRLQQLLTTSHQQAPAAVYNQQAPAAVYNQPPAAVYQQHPVAAAAKQLVRGSVESDLKRPGFFSKKKDVRYIYAYANTHKSPCLSISLCLSLSLSLDKTVSLI